MPPQFAAASNSSASPRTIPSTATAASPSTLLPPAAWPSLRGVNKLPASVNAGARLDRLPSSAFHRRILLLIAIGMFFDGFDVYLSATVLGATLKSGFSALAQNAQFVSVTF